MEYTKQNDLLLQKLLIFYDKNNYLNKMLNIINGDSNISLRIVDWFTTNYAKQYSTTLINDNIRFKVYCNCTLLFNNISYFSYKFSKK